jgi:hypothetical protein
VAAPVLHFTHERRIPSPELHGLLYFTLHASLLNHRITSRARVEAAILSNNVAPAEQIAENETYSLLKGCVRSQLCH